MKISDYPIRSAPTEEGTAVQAPQKKGGRAGSLVVVAAILVLILLAGTVVQVPYLSDALKRGYSLLSGGTTTGPGTTSTTSTNPSGSETTTVATCASVVNTGNLVAPDIKNGAANVTYPPDYCTFAAYALGQINADRAANGTGPVTLDYNQAAQQHADSMLYYGYFSHFDTQGYKPYMRYTLLGGVASDFENVAYLSYSVSHFTSVSPVEDAIKTLEHNMVYDDVACCNNGHRYNILDPLHTSVSIGVAYNSTHVYFDEEFENNYVSMSFAVTQASASNPYHVTMSGTASAGLIPSCNPQCAIYIAYDLPPTAESTSALNSGPHEYDPGTLIGGVLPQNSLGGCAQFTSGVTVCADTWKFSSSQVDITFALKPFIDAEQQQNNSGPGVYTIYLVTGTDTNSAITSISVFVA